MTDNKYNPGCASHFYPAWLDMNGNVKYVQGADGSIRRRTPKPIMGRAKRRMNRRRVNG